MQVGPTPSVVPLDEGPSEVFEFQQVRVVFDNPQENIVDENGLEPYQKETGDPKIDFNAEMDESFRF